MLTHTLYTIVEMLNYFLIFYIFFGRLPAKGVPKYIVFLCSIFAFNLLPLNVELDTYVFFALGFLMSIFLVNGSKQENMINFIFFHCCFCIFLRLLRIYHLKMRQGF